MDSISFTQRIRPVSKAEFLRYTPVIDNKNFVDSPWLVNSSRIAKDVITKDIYDCTALLMTDGEKAFLMHLDPSNKENHNFDKIFKFISNSIDLSKKEWQAALVGSKTDNDSSCAVFNALMRFLTNRKIPTTILKDGIGPTHLAYRTCTDEILVTNTAIDNLKNLGKKAKDVLTGGFKSISISECDEIV